MYIRNIVDVVLMWYFVTIIIVHGGVRRVYCSSFSAATIMCSLHVWPHHVTQLFIVQFHNISILPPTEGSRISWGVGGSVRPKNIKKCMKLNWNFQWGWGVLEKIPSVGQGWIFS